MHWICTLDGSTALCLKHPCMFDPSLSLKSVLTIGLAKHGARLDKNHWRTT